MDVLGSLAGAESSIGDFLYNAWYGTQSPDQVRASQADLRAGIAKAGGSVAAQNSAANEFQSFLNKYFPPLSPLDKVGAAAKKSLSDAFNFFPDLSLGGGGTDSNGSSKPSWLTLLLYVGLIVLVVWALAKLLE